MIEIKLNPQRVEAFKARGWAYIHKKDDASAISDFEYALKLDPNDSAAHEVLSLIYEDNHAIDLALFHMNEAIRIEPQNQSLYVRRISIYSIGKDWDSAIHYCNEMLKTFPYGRHIPGVYSKRGRAYSKKGKYDVAIADYKKAIELEPQNLSYLLNRGETYIQKGDKYNARRDFERVIELANQDTGADLFSASNKYYANQARKYLAELQ